jgi:hypothetical protein
MGWEHRACPTTDTAWQPGLLRWLARGWAWLLLGGCQLCQALLQGLPQHLHSSQLPLPGLRLKRHATDFSLLTANTWTRLTYGNATVDVVAATAGCADLSRLKGVGVLLPTGAAEVLGHGGIQLQNRRRSNNNPCNTRQICVDCVRRSLLAWQLL